MGIMIARLAKMRIVLNKNGRKRKFLALMDS